MADVPTAKYKDIRWDDENRPKGYIIGVTPGFAQYGQGDEKLTNMGLARKIMKAARLGFDFCQIDYEALSEMFEADIKEQINHIKTSQGDIHTGRKFEVGLHLQTDIDLCIAGAYDWKIMHDRLTKGAYSAKILIGAKYILFHTSSRIRPHVTFDFGQQEPRTPLFAFDGANLGDFMRDVDKCGYIDPKRKLVACPKVTPDGGPFEGMEDWFKGKFINILFQAMGSVGDVGTITFFDRFMIEEMGSGFKAGEKSVEKENDKISEKFLGKMKEYKDKDIAEIKKEIDKLSDMVEERQKNGQPTADLENKIREHTFRAQQINSGANESDYRRKILEKHPDIKEDYKKFGNTAHYLENTDFGKVFEFWRRHGSEAEEQIAYKVIAKYMWVTRDPLWADIVGIQYDPDKITYYNEQGDQYYRTNPKVHDSGKSGPTVKLLVERMITAVASKYIEGHLYVCNPRWSMRADDEDLQRTGKDMSVYDYCKDSKMHIYIETAMPPQGQEGQLRIMSARDHVKLVKNLDGGKIISYCLDFEHITVNYIRVPEDLATLDPGEAKYITMVHINAPRPIIGAHAPIDQISHDMLIIYSWLHQMKTLGMNDAYFIWEMGSYGVQASAIAFRRFVGELRKGTDPKDLPADFYGIDEMFERQQWVNMKEHAYDPLKGLIVNPEEDHGLMSTEAVRKSKLAEWLAGRYR